MTQPPPDPESAPPVPHSIEAEQQVLGTILTNNDALARLDLRPDDFFDPVHGRIFEIAQKRIHEGGVASPVTLKAAMGTDPGLDALGGPAYLARLAVAAISAHAARDYARVVREKRQARDLIAAAEAAAKAIREGQTPREAAAIMDKASMALATDSSRDGPVSWLRATTDVIEQANAAYQGEEIPGVPTGIPELDAILGPMRPGYLTILGGRPGMGKSALAISIATRAAKAGHPVAFASLEMTPDGIAVRGLTEEMAHGGMNLPYSDAMQGEMSEEQFRRLVDVARDMEALPFWFLPRQFGELSALRAGLRQCLMRARGLPKMPLLVVDYLQLMDVAGASRFEKVTEISRGLKTIAMTEGMPVLALSQLSRGVDSRQDRRPMLADLRESGQIEQDADQVLFAYREEYYLAREEPHPGDEPDEHLEWQARMEAVRGRLEIIVAKQRQGRLGTARVRFAPATNRIWGDAA